MQEMVYYINDTQHVPSVCGGIWSAEESGLWLAGRSIHQAEVMWRQKSNMVSFSHNKHMKMSWLSTFNLNTFSCFHKALTSNKSNKPWLYTVVKIMFNSALDQQPASSASDQSKYSNSNWNFQWKKLKVKMRQWVNIWICYCTIAVNCIFGYILESEVGFLPLNIAHSPYD